MSVDPITLQVIQARLAGIVQEMQNSLFRTGYSTIIRESQDASCAILNTKGEVVAQHVVLPLHMGAFPACGEAILKAFPSSDVHDGDAFIINHPYLGGSPHAPDMGVLTPIFYLGEWVGFAANMAHKSDIGGTVPGSGSGNAREIYQEGLHLPPIKFVSRLQPVKEIDALITANSRTPALVIGDLRGQVGAARLGERRIAELMERYGKTTVLESTELLSAYTENRVRQTIASWPDGESAGESFVDHDGIDLTRQIRIHVKVKKLGDQLHFDFTASSDQTQGPANIRPPLVRAACAYCLVSLADQSRPRPHHRRDVSPGKRRRSALSGGGEYLYAHRAHSNRSGVESSGALCSRQANFRRFRQRGAGARRPGCRHGPSLRALRDF
jgi:N-methylhydantoinase B